jgi:hypothetical protein
MKSEEAKCAVCRKTYPNTSIYYVFGVPEKRWDTGWICFDPECVAMWETFRELTYVGKGN